MRVERFIVGAAVVSSLALLGVGAAQQKTVRVGLGYIPDVQFAPFYLAQQSGLYKAAGLEVEFQHGYTSELYPLLAAEKLDFVVGDAEDVVLLRAKDAKAAPFRFIMAMYQSVPNALFSKAEKNIKTIADLKGKNIGIPGKFGTSWTSLQAVLRAANLKETDVKITEVGFTQLEAVLADRVDVAMGFVNNEPVVAGARGIKLNVIPAGRFNRSPGNGVLTTDARLKDAASVRAFLSASQRGLAQTISAPKTALEAAKKYVQGLSDDRLAVLEASVPLYQSAFSRVEGLGFSNPNGWQALIDLLGSVGRLEGSVKRGDFYTNAYLTPKIQVK
jgi:NitT/TauT family transport system substrate-binding protein